MKGEDGGCVKGFQEREKVRWGEEGEKWFVCAREKKTGRDREETKVDV